MSVALKKPSPLFSALKTAKDCDWVRSCQYKAAVCLMTMAWNTSATSANGKMPTGGRENIFEWCPCDPREGFDGLEVATWCDY